MGKKKQQAKNKNNTGENSTNYRKVSNNLRQHKKIKKQNKQFQKRLAQQKHESQDDSSSKTHNPGPVKEVGQTFYFIDKILKHRTLKDGREQVLVSWRGYSKFCNRWVDKQKIMGLTQSTGTQNTCSQAQDQRQHKFEVKQYLNKNEINKFLEIQISDQEQQQYSKKGQQNLQEIDPQNQDLEKIYISEKQEDEQDFQFINQNQSQYQQQQILQNQQQKSQIINNQKYRTIDLNFNDNWNQQQLKIIEMFYNQKQKEQQQKQDEKNNENIITKLVQNINIKENINQNQEIDPIMQDIMVKTRRNTRHRASKLKSFPKLHIKSKKQSNKNQQQIPPKITPNIIQCIDLDDEDQNI